MNKNYLYELTYELNAAAVEVHKFFGPNLLESIYQKCLMEEFEQRGIQYKSELIVPVVYKNKTVNAFLRCDFLIEDCIVIETKSVQSLLPIHDAQLLTYMQLLKAPKGILYNFNVDNLLHQGQKTLVNKWYPTH